jgi:hypothetical protein
MQKPLEKALRLVLHWPLLGHCVKNLTSDPIKLFTIVSSGALSLARL